MSDDTPTGTEASPGASSKPLEARVERLERLVRHLMAEKEGRPGPRDGRTSAPPPRPTAATGPTPPPPPRTARTRKTGADWLRLGEDWLGRVGILLLLLGLAFLYRYAIDRGWITPWLRVSFGLALGAGLLGFGLTRLRSRPLYSQVLLGGAVAVLYLTGWAAEVLYDLVPWSLGFSFMAMVTVLALALAERREHQVLAVIGAAGGLATPFLLDSPTQSVTGLVVYASLVLGWAGLLQLRRGWGVLLTVNVVGGMAVMAVAADLAVGLEAWVAQAGIVLAWAVACVFPFLQGWLHLRQPAVWPPTPSLQGVGRRGWPEGGRNYTDAGSGEEGLPGPDAGPAGVPSGVSGGVLAFLGVTVSAVAVILTAVNWDLERVGTGLTFLAAASLLLVGSSVLHPRLEVSRPARGAGALLLVAGTALTAGGDWLPFPLALEAAAILWIARQEEAAGLEALAHAIFVVLALVFVGHLDQTGDEAHGVFAGGVLGSIAVAVGCAVGILRRGLGARTYLLGAWAAFLVWLAWQLSPLPGGQGLVSGAWGAVALLLLFMGVQTRSLPARMLGLTTLALVAGKLLLVDLAALDAGLRIVLFLGFGGLFLYLGYLFKGGDTR